MHYAYILRSVADDDLYYYGSTADLKKRLVTHNVGGNVSTKLQRPWSPIWYGGFPSEETAKAFERYLKTASGKAFARKRLDLAAFKTVVTIILHFLQLALHTAGKKTSSAGRRSYLCPK